MCTRRRKILVAIGNTTALLLCMLTISAVQAAEITWHVVHPFRYFKQPSDLWLQQQALEELQQQNPDAARFAPISHIERKLNNPSWWKTHPQILKRLKEMRVREGRSPELDIRLGWGSFLTNSAPADRGEINQLCWDASAQRYSNCDRSELHGTTGGSEFFERTDESRRYSIRKGRYIYPKFHRIVLEVRDPPDRAKLCAWSAPVPIFLSAEDDFQRERLSLETSCDESVAARVKYVPEAATGERGVDVTVEMYEGSSDGDIVESASDRVEVRDILIFALGDSYSSGEGNPEIPAKLHPTRAIGRAEPSGIGPYPGNSRKFWGIPRRSPAGGGSSAIWTDRRCHRSVYSYQTRVALQLAIAPDQHGNHHHAVTYLQFTCSGAEVTEDILYGWEGRECLRAAMSERHSGRYHSFYMPQISKASSELCQRNRTGNGLEQRWLTEIAGNDARLLSGDHYLLERRHFVEDVRYPACGFKRDRAITSDPSLWFCRPGARARPIDLVLSTVGGNDVGFSKVVAKAVVNKEQELVSLIGDLPVIGAIVEKALFVDKAEAMRRIARLPQRLAMYNRSLEDFLGVQASANGTPVVAMAYPNLIYQHVGNDEERFCPGGNSNTDVSEFLSINEDFLPDVEEIVEKECNSFGRECGLIGALRVAAKRFKWRFVESHRRLFRDHGICVTKPDESPNESGMNTAEIPGIPYKLVDLTKHGNDNQYADPWRRYDPVMQYFPYESRKSGFRSPVQDFMNIQYFKERMPDAWEEEEKASAIFLAKRILGGSFHPTAEAHSHIADHVYCEAREQLFGETCDPQKVKLHAHPW